MNLLIRADASIQMGTGHVMRCLALAQTWQDRGGQVALAAAALTPALEQRLNDEQVQVIKLSEVAGSLTDAKAMATLAHQLNSPWIVVDGYQFGAAYQKALKTDGLKVLFVDDYGHADFYYADLVLNQNLYAHEGLYQQRSPQTRLLLGPDYVLLRREFWPWQGWQRPVSPIARKVLVTLGGADPDNVTLKAVQALQQLDGLEAIVVVGSSNPHYELLESITQASLGLITLQHNVTNMPDLMAWADLAIAAGGSTAWELAFMGLPSLMIMLAENQRAVVEKLSEMGVAVNLGWHEDILLTDLAPILRHWLMSRELREQMVNQAQRLVDGEGGARVVMQFEQSRLRIRRVRPNDCELLWQWANDPEVRAFAFSSEPIPWESHVQWFTQKLHDPNCHLWIALDRHDVPIGQIRFDVQSNQQAEIDISIDQMHRGLGYGSYLIDQAVRQFFRETAITRVCALIKPHNARSIQAFKQAGFQLAREASINSSTVMQYVCGRNGKE